MIILRFYQVGLQGQKWKSSSSHLWNHIWKNAKWLVVHWKARGSSPRSKAWSSLQSPVQVHRGKAKGPAREARRLWRQVFQGNCKDQSTSKGGKKGRCPSFPFNFIQTTNLLVGATHIQSGFPPQFAADVSIIY